MTKKITEKVDGYGIFPPIISIKLYGFEASEATTCRNKIRRLLQTTAYVNNYQITTVVSQVADSDGNVKQHVEISALHTQIHGLQGGLRTLGIEMTFLIIATESFTFRKI